MVLAVTDQKIPFLINPTTLEYHKIPNYHPVPNGRDSFSTYGLGYDSISDDYKVVTLSYDGRNDYNTDNWPDICHTCVDVYSVRKGLSRRLFESKKSPWGGLYSYDCGAPVKRVLHWSAPERDSRFLRSSPDWANGVLVRGIWINGALHWLATEGSDFSPVIVAFDLSEEKFLEVPSRTTLEKGKHVVNKLVDLGGCLCMFSDTKKREVFG